MDEVVKRGGWSFLLPEGHRLIVDEERKTVTLDAGGGRISTYRLVATATEDDEVIYEIDADYTNGDGYPFPSVGDEIERLRKRWEAAGGDLTRFTGWAEGSSYDSHLRRLRKELRRLEEPRAAAG